MKSLKNRNSKILAMFLLIFFAIAILFRIYQIENIPGLNGDETWYALLISKFFAGQPVNLIAPTGRPLINPFFLLILWPILGISPPTFWILRLPSLLSGIILIPLTYWLTNRIYGSYVALICTIFMAALPINIGYARFGWDPSQITLVSLIAIYFALVKNWTGLILAFLAALLIHPNCIFLTPILLGAILLPWLFSKPMERLGKVRWVCFLTGLGLITFSVTWPIFNNRYPADIDINRLFKFNELSQFSLDFVRLFSGDTIYEYIVGPRGQYGNPLAEVIVLLLVFVLLSLGLPRLLKQKRYRDLGLIVGLLIAILFFYIFIGVLGLRPTTERYGVFLIVPTILSLAILLSTFENNIKIAKTIQIGTCVAGLILLLGFYPKYFQAFYQTGGQSEQTFMTAAIEPKKQALSWIESDNKNNDKYAIVAEDFWLYMPLKYLTYKKENINVINFENEKDNITKNKLYDLTQAQKIYVIGWHRENPLEKFEGVIQEQLLEKKVILNYPNNPLIHIYKLQ